MKAQTCGRDCLAKGAATVKSATETRITAKANRRSPGPAGQVDSKVAVGVMWRAICALDVRGMWSIRTCSWPMARRVKGSLHIWNGFGGGFAVMEPLRRGDDRKADGEGRPLVAD